MAESVEEVRQGRTTDVVVVSIPFWFSCSCWRGRTFRHEGARTAAASFLLSAAGPVTAIDEWPPACRAIDYTSSGSVPFSQLASLRPRKASRRPILTAAPDEQP
jgi:hypothetical protein